MRRNAKRKPTKQRRSAKTAAAPSSPAGDNQVYTLEVCLMGGPVTEEFLHEHPQITRTIEIRGRQTLEDLHLAIFDAFDRFDEHLYEFQFGAGPMDPDGPRYLHPAALEGDVDSADEATIDALNLEVGRSFGYWFDFGDDWWHQINVVAVGGKPSRGKYPNVTERTGASPPQYPGFDDEDA